ncbi:MAG: hypothetical protein KAI24_17145, partial [Planctomycetes bacterium]|nr:hypothetical protein [Planctomycetota bacterium]
MLSLVLSQQSFVLPSNAVEENVLLWNLANLVILFVVVGVLGWLTWRLLPHIPVFNRIMLVPPGPGTAPASNSAPSELGLSYDRLVALVGRTGTAATTLRPTGAMTIDDERIDVVTEGDWVDAGQAVRVLYVQGNRVVVAAEEAPPRLPPDSPDREGERGSVGVVLLLAVIGLLLIFLEVMFVSMGVIGIAAAGCLLGSIFVAFQESLAFGIGVTVFEAIAAPIVFWSAFKVLPKTPFGKHLILTGPPTDGHAGAADHRLDPLVGKTGTALSTLRPAGFARIDGRKVDVVTRGEMIEQGQDVVVLEVRANRVVVAVAKAAANQP